MGSKVTKPKPTRRSSPAGLKMTQFPPDIWRIITSYLKFDMVHSLLLVGNKRLMHILTTENGVETVNVINSFKSSADPWDASEESELQNEYAPTRLYRSVKNLEIFPALKSFSYWINDPFWSVQPFEALGLIRLPKSVTSLELTTSLTEDILLAILGPNSSALPKLQTLILHDSGGHIKSIKAMPQTLTDLELSPISISELMEVSEHLPPNLTRLCVKSSQAVLQTRDRTSDAQYHLKLPLSVTDLHIIDLELLTNEAWFLCPEHVNRLSVTFMPLKSIQYLPKSLTHLSVANVPTFDDSTFSHLPHLTSFSCGTPGLVQTKDQFPVIPSLTELSVRFKSVTPLLKWIDNPSTLPTLTRLNMPFTDAKESLLQAIPSQIKILILRDVFLQGYSVPDGVKSINSISDLLPFFIAKRWPFTLRLLEPKPLVLGGLLERVPNSVTSLKMPHKLAPSNLPSSLTVISHLRLEPGCLEYLPRTLTELQAKVDSDPIKNKSYLTSSELIHLPPNLRTLKLAVICLLSNSIPLESGGHQKLCLPSDAEQNLKNRFPKCDMSSCDFDPFFLLSDLPSIKIESLVLQGGCIYLPQNFYFEEGLLELRAEKITFSHERLSPNSFIQLLNLPSTLQSLSISGPIANSFALDHSTGRLPEGLKILHIYHSSDWATGNARYAGLQQLTNLELLSVSFATPKRMKPSIPLPDHLKFQYLNETCTTLVGSSRPLKSNELAFGAIAPLDSSTADEYLQAYV